VIPRPRDVDYGDDLGAAVTVAGYQLRHTPGTGFNGGVPQHIVRKLLGAAMGTPDCRLTFRG
jgi:hypothetical protein